ncbi:UNVERIFIED_CONTAM: hypothetical protein NY603_27110, partial [Bacteroidetes bacterium 56_B9]
VRAGNGHNSSTATHLGKAGVPTTIEPTHKDMVVFLVRLELWHSAWISARLPECFTPFSSGKPFFRLDLLRAFQNQ